MKNQWSLILVVTSCMSSSVHAIDGAVVPPAPGDLGYSGFFPAMEAVCGFGRTKNLTSLLGEPEEEHKTFCGGILVAENIVLLPWHCFSESELSGIFDQVVSAVDSEGAMINADTMWYTKGFTTVPRWTVRFRLNQNGTTVGTLNDGFESYFQVPVKRIVFPSFNSVDGSQEIDMVLLILADNNNDQDQGGIWFDGWMDPSHISPVPVVPTVHRSSELFSGALASYGPNPNPSPGDIASEGTLRFFPWSF